MDEYFRIIIEEYCMNHPKTKKADFLWEMVHMSMMLHVNQPIDK